MTTWGQGWGWGWKVLEMQEYMTTCGWGVWWVVAWCWDAGIYDYLQGEGWKQ